jgi:two-component system, NarL family, nitrate/nitrite response regulator NarL
LDTVPLVAVVTDVLLYRDALEHVLREQARVEIVGSFGWHRADSSSIIGARPDVILADVAIVCGTGFVNQIRAQLPNAHVVAFGVAEDTSQILACARAGAHGFVLRSASGPELAAAVTRIAGGELVCSARIAAMLFSALGAGKPPEPFGDLTTRETQVLALLEQGCSNKEIARRLVIEVPTVKHHVHNVYEKLGVERRAAAVAAAQRQRAAAGS